MKFNELYEAIIKPTTLVKKNIQPANNFQIVKFLVNLIKKASAEDPEYKQMFGKYINQLLLAKTIKQVVKIWIDMAWDAPEATRVTKTYVKDPKERQELLSWIALTYNQWST